MSIERKWYDQGPSGVYTTDVYTGGSTAWTNGIASLGDTSWNVGWLTGNSEGSGETNRVGQAIILDSLDYRLTIVPDTSAAASGTRSTVRFIVAIDEEQQGAAPSIAALIGPDSTTVANGLIQNFINPSFFGRFRVLEDKYFSWQYSVQVTAASFNVIEPLTELAHERHHDLRGHKVRWDSTNNSAIANARAGHIFAFLLYENASSAAGITAIATTNPPQVFFHSRIRYRDADSM